MLLYLVQVGREYRVQKALFAAGFPVPEPLLYCEDISVIGTEFYVMKHVQVGDFYVMFCLFTVHPWVNQFRATSCNLFHVLKRLWRQVSQPAASHAFWRAIFEPKENVKKKKQDDIR